MLDQKRVWGSGSGGRREEGRLDEARQNRRRAEIVGIWKRNAIFFHSSRGGRRA